MKTNTIIIVGAVAALAYFLTRGTGRALGDAIGGGIGGAILGGGRAGGGGAPAFAQLPPPLPLDGVEPLGSIEVDEPPVVRVFGSRTFTQEMADTFGLRPGMTVGGSRIRVRAKTPPSAIVSGGSTEATRAHNAEVFRMRRFGNTTPTLVKMPAGARPRVAVG